MDKMTLTGLGLQSKAMTAFSQFIWASEIVRARLFALLSSHGLTASQFGVLDALYHLGPRSQKQLGYHILKSGGNITLVVDNLEKVGLVRRERSDSDRRVMIVHITAMGKDLFSRILPVTVESIDEVMRNLSSSELEELGRLCVKLVSNQGGDNQ